MTWIMASDAFFPAAYAGVPMWLLPPGPSVEDHDKRLGPHFSCMTGGGLNYCEELLIIFVCNVFLAM